MDFAGYEIFVTNQSLPHLDEPWTRVDANNNTYYFQRSSDKSKPFTISGYISKSTWAATRAEAEGLNDALNSSPSGVFTDGYHMQYGCLVDSWEISPVAGVNKYTFSITGRVLT